MKRFFVSYLAIAVLVISAAFTSCGKDDDGDNGSTGSTVSGTIDPDDLAGSNWTQVGVSFDGGETFERKVPITNGKFTIELPTPSAAQLGEADDLIDDMDDMPSNITISEKDVKGVAAEFYVLDANGSSQEAISLIVGNVDLKGNGTIESAGWMYVDKNVNISGNQNLTEEGINVTMSVDLKLKQGWNSMLMIMKYSNAGMSINIKSGQPPAGLWMVIANDY